MKEFESDDGWNTEAFENVGLIGAFEEVAKLDYEIKNCVRLSSAEDLVSKLKNIAGDIEAVADELENELD